MEKIELYNRDNVNVWLENIGGKKWELKSDKPDYIGGYCRFIFEDYSFPPVVFAIDPPGGPFISVGQKISGYQVEKIVGFILTLKPLDE